MQSQMPKQTKPFLAVWIGGLLIAAALIAAAFAGYFYSHTAK
jgi:quinol-cytochrome oxidoreductase complex cytochrome b subunit